MNKKMKKIDLAKAIEAHHLYEPITCSKNYYRYDSWCEIQELMKKTKAELQDMYDFAYGSDGRELTSHEMNW